MNYELMNSPFIILFKSIFNNAFYPKNILKGQLTPFTKKYVPTFTDIFGFMCQGF